MAIRVSYRTSMNPRHLQTIRRLAVGVSSKVWPDHSRQAKELCVPMVLETEQDRDVFAIKAYSHGFPVEQGQASVVLGIVGSFQTEHNFVLVTNYMFGEI